MTPTGLGWFWRPARVYVIGCNAKTPVFIASIVTNMSNRWVCTLAAAVAVIGIYLLIVTATYRRRLKSRRSGATNDNDHPTRDSTKYRGWFRHLDPVVLTAGPNGRGSITKLQILFFSLIVFELLFYIFMRTGKLSDLSKAVLLLMGIAGVGAAASTGTDVAKNRLDFENWTWLVNKRWLPKGGVGEINLARWQDIVTTDGEFDVYRFQMVIFSLVVGVSLMATGLGDLASFDIPTALLGILGLSQVVYVGGKLVAPPSCADLNKKLADFRVEEDAFRKKALTGGAPTSIDALKERVGVPDYDAYRASAQSLRTMFQSTLGVAVGDDKFDDTILFRQTAGAGPALTQVAPNAVPRGSPFTLEITGTELALVDKAEIKAGTAQIPATEALSNSTLVRAKFSVPLDAPLGHWDVTVNDQSGRSATLQDGLIVIGPKPVLKASAPKQVTKPAKDQKLSLEGDYLDQIVNVKIKLGAAEIDGTNVQSSPTTVTTTLTIPAEMLAGSWDIIVTDKTGRFEILSGGLTVN
jgi:hypothetical protein